MPYPRALKAVRLIHNYLGVFFAPTILFFAMTGAVQMFGLHETTRGSSYKPPDLLVHLSQLHKKGSWSLPQRRPAPPPAAAPAPAAATAPTPAIEASKPDAPKPESQKPAGPAHNPWPMKIFFVLAADMLVLSTLTGLVLAFVYSRRKLVVAGVLFAGIAVPLIILAI